MEGEAPNTQGKEQDRGGSGCSPGGRMRIGRRERIV